jgi:hypothetical protein
MDALLLTGLWMMLILGGLALYDYAKRHKKSAK